MLVLALAAEGVRLQEWNAEMSIVIREAVEADLTDVLEIYNYAVRETTATFDLQEQTMEQRQEWFRKYGGKHPLLVAELEGRAAGYCCLSTFRAKPAYDRTVELSVYIHPDHWGKGIARALMTNVLRRARELGHHSVVSCITAGNEISVRLHEAFGFRYVGTFRECGWKFDAWQDVMFYELLLQGE